MQIGVAIDAGVGYSGVPLSWCPADPGGEKGIRCKSVALDRRCEQGPTSPKTTAGEAAGREGAAFGGICKPEDLPGNHGE